MAEPFLSEIRVFAFNFAPEGWALCNGQLLPINQYQALFSLLGTTYGGNGTSNFQLPNLQGNVAVHQGTSPSGVTAVLGQTGGNANVTLNLAEIPSHTHSLLAVNATANTANPTNAALAVPDVNARLQNLYGTSPTTTLSNSAVGELSGGQPHNNIQPSLVLNFCIALVGIYPSRS